MYLQVSITKWDGSRHVFNPKLFLLCNYKKRNKYFFVHWKTVEKNTLWTAMAFILTLIYIMAK